jgi:uncharacterized protein (DUF305 family)
MTHQSLRSLFASVVLVVSLSACSSVSVSNEEKRFVGELMPHHNVGVELLEIGQQRSNDVRVRRLIFEMGDYHHGELHSLELYARDWSVEEYEEFDGDIPDAELDRLRNLRGREHDVLWLDLMIRHHEGALVISHRLLSAGGNQNLLTMASNVIKMQADEIVEMVRLRKELCNEGPTC